MCERRTVTASLYCPSSLANVLSNIATFYIHAKNKIKQGTLQPNFSREVFHHTFCKPCKLFVNLWTFNFCSVQKVYNGFSYVFILCRSNCKNYVTLYRCSIFEYNIFVHVTYESYNIWINCFNLQLAVTVVRVKTELRVKGLQVCQISLYARVNKGFKEIHVNKVRHRIEIHEHEEYSWMSHLVSNVKNWWVLDVFTRKKLITQKASCDNVTLPSGRREEGYDFATIL